MISWTELQIWSRLLTMLGLPINLKCFIWKILHFLKIFSCWLVIKPWSLVSCFHSYDLYFSHKTMILVLGHVWRSKPSPRVCIYVLIISRPPRWTCVELYSKMSWPLLGVTWILPPFTCWFITNFYWNFSLCAVRKSTQWCWLSNFKSEEMGTLVLSIILKLA